MTEKEYIMAKSIGTLESALRDIGHLTKYQEVLELIPDEEMKIVFPMIHGWLDRLYEFRRGKNQCE